MSHYLFIDGGYLRARYKETMTDFYGSADMDNLDFDSLRQQIPAQKLFITTAWMM